MPTNALLASLDRHRRKWFFGLVTYTLAAFAVLITFVLHTLSQPGQISKPTALVLTALTGLTTLGAVSAMGIPILLFFAPPSPAPAWRKALFYFQLTCLALMLASCFLPFIFILSVMP